MNSATKRVLEANTEVANVEPEVKQDCTDIVHISLFFDGTGNNKDVDKEKKKWSNPARLWRNAEALRESRQAKDWKSAPQIYSIYVSGVGTRFNGELNIFQRAYAKIVQDNFIGLGVGTGGTRRLDYGEEQLNDALAKALVNEAKKAEKDLGKYVNEKKEYSFSKIDEQLKEHRLIKKINFYAFGFSRGAALARAFTNQFMWKCEANGDDFTYGEGKYPVEFKFLGIFDTVASFGLPATNLNNNLTYKGRDMVVDSRVKNCVHYVAANELRFCFPVDLIEQKGELANKNWKEIVYPGMHSDVGGGYTPGSQNTDDHYARIPLKDMLEEAVNVGVPMYSYEQLKEKHTDLFTEQFKIQPDVQKYYDAVQAAVKPSKSVRTTINDYMKLYYSAYGTINRKGETTASDRAREDRNILFKILIPWGPRDMATEMNRLQTVKKGSATYKVLSPVSTSYEYMIRMDDWILDSWNTDASEDVSKFYADYVHDSKYGFMINFEPFSYFRQRTVYEPRRSRKGQEVDQQHIDSQTLDTNQDVTQSDLIASFEQAQLALLQIGR